MRKVYLDYAAAAPMCDEAIEAMRPFFAGNFYNPSATYLAGRAARRELEAIRHRVAVVLGAKPAEIIFTAGATEANNLAIQGVMRQYPEGELLVSAVEHESVLEPGRRFGARQIPVDECGVIILNKLSNLITDKTVLVSVMYVNNELGTVQPLNEIARLLEKVRAERLEKGHKLPIYLHADAAQAGNYLDMHTSRLGVDLMSVNGGKLYGPKQSGTLFIRAGLRLEPLIVGGGQEFGLRSGTENLAAAAGFARALEVAAARRANEARRTAELRERLENQLAAAIPNVIINGPKKGRAPHIISATFPGADNERLMMELDERGVMCAVGSACSASRQEASHVLSAIGLGMDEARATLRFSLGHQTTTEDLDYAIGQLTSLATG